MNIALLGFGTVGKGVYEIIRRKASSDTAAIEVSHILIYEGHDEKTMDIMTYDYEEILKDPACTTVVEVIGGIEPAHTYILKALRSGRNVVTANKAVVAAHMEEFIETARPVLEEMGKPLPEDTDEARKALDKYIDEDEYVDIRPFEWEFTIC